MAAMTSHGKTTFVLALLLHLSVAVVGNAFSSISSPIDWSKNSKKFHVLATTKADSHDEDLELTRKAIMRHERSMQNRKIVNNEKQKQVQPQESLRGGSSSNSTLPSEVPTLPNLESFQKFALPCLGLWVSGPLLSLVDTSFVGLSGTAQQLAALGPATTFFDGVTYLFAFLNVATTNLYSSARARSGQQSEEAEGVVRTASRVALNFGLCVTILVLAYCKPLIALYIGEQAASTPGLLQSASDYVKIRALSIPTTLLLGVLQAALLGAKDSVTPLVAVLYSTIVNIFGDYILVNRLKMGIQGAAVATLLAQWVATIALVRPARQRLVKDHNLGLMKRKVKSAISGRSFLAFAAPVLTLILGKMSAFGFMTHSAAAIPGQPIPLASHQIILSLFFFVSPFLEVLSQTAQAFVPPYLAPVNEHIEKTRRVDKNYDPEKDEQVQKWISASHAVSSKLLRIGMVVTVIVATLSSLIPAFFGGMITTDSAVKSAVKPLAKYLWIGGFLTAPVAISEGVLLARRELGFLATIYVISTALLPSALLRVKHVGGNVAQVWGCFAVFQLFRAACFAGKVWGGQLVATLTKGKEKSTQDPEVGPSNQPA